MLKIKFTLLALLFCFTNLNSQVFVCGGEYSKKYHADPNCRGLNNCRSGVYEMDEDEAVEIGRTPCQIEYIIDEGVYNYTNNNSIYSSQKNIEDPELQWIFKDGGNPIDGFYKRAMVVNKDWSRENSFTLFIQNTSDDLKINKYVIGENSNYEYIKILLFNEKQFSSIDEVLFYFNNEKIFYKANYQPLKSKKGFAIRSAISNDKNQFIGKIRLINALKSKSDVFVRIKFIDGSNKNLEFTLNKSKDAINKTVDTSFWNNGDRGDTVETIIGSFGLGQFYNQEYFKNFAIQNNLDKSINMDLTDYILDKIGGKRGIGITRISSSQFLDNKVVVYDWANKEIFKENIFNVLNNLYPKREIALTDKNLDPEYKDFDKSDQEIPFAVIKDVPIYPGCENVPKLQRRTCFQEKINEHIRKNFSYPQIAQEIGIQGRVYVQFVINQEGYIENIRTRGPDINLEKAAKEIILKLPKLKPGLSNGKAVRVPFSIPITFRLQ